MARVSTTGRRVFRGLAIVAVASSLAACQSDTVIPPIVVVTPPPVRGIIVPWQSFPAESDVWISIELILSQKGALDITVDWTFPDSWIYVYFGATKCDYSQLADKTCPFLISSETQNPKPRVLYTDVLEPATYYLVFYNVPYNRETGIGSNNNESIALQIGLTVTAAGTGRPIQLGRPTVVTAPRLPRP